MPSRKDQLHSYQFMVQRTISALVMRETDPAQSPLRRGIGAAFVGVMVTVIVAAAFGIYGLLTKTGNAEWKVEGAVVVEKGTGAPFVYLNGKLVPTLNYTSALLLAGRTPPQTFTVSSNSLAGVARDLTRGIPGAPGGLPAAKNVLGGAWTACALPATDVAGGATVTTVLAVGQPATQATGGALTTVMGDLSLYVRDASEGGQFLIWHGHRYRLSGATVPTALFASGTRPVSVGSAWLDTLPEADPITDLLVPHLGRQSTAVADRRIGDIVVDHRDTGDVNYLVLADGLARLTPLQLDLLRAARQINSVTLQPAEIAAAKKSDQLVSDSPADRQAPEQIPRLATTSATSGICAEFGGRTGTPVLRVAADASRATAGTPTGSRTSGGAALADVVAVPGGSVGVARSLESGTYSLVTDVGIQFPVESAEVLGTLGYSTSDATALPAAVLNRIPSGPALTKAGAAKARTSGN